MQRMPIPDTHLQKKILDLVKEAGAAGLSWPELVTLTGADVIALAIAISNLVHDGALAVQGQGTTEDPRRYWLACPGCAPVTLLRAHA